jgi:hypothetical protein
MPKFTRATDEQLMQAHEVVQSMEGTNKEIGKALGVSDQTVARVREMAPSLSSFICDRVIRTHELLQRANGHGAPAPAAPAPAEPRARSVPRGTVADHVRQASLHMQSALGNLRDAAAVATRMERIGIEAVQARLAEVEELLTA